MGTGSVRLEIQQMVGMLWRTIDATLSDSLSLSSSIRTTITEYRRSNNNLLKPIKSIKEETAMRWATRKMSMITDRLQD